MKIVFLLLALLVPCAAGQTPLLSLPVHVHLMRSSSQPRMQATLTENAVRDIFSEVNAIWSRAGIRFDIVAVHPLQALDLPPKKWFVRDRNWVKAAIPAAQFNTAAIDVCFVRDMGPNGFFYGEPVVVCEKPEFTKVSGGSDNPVARVAAHELGHVLFLKHRQDHTNLMASGRNGVSLNHQEIRDARTRAMQILSQWRLP